MISIDSRWRSRAVAGLIGLAQYSMPVPSGNATSSRPPRHHVEHGVFLGQAIGIFQIGRRAPHADLGVRGLRNERRGDQLGAAIML